MNAEILRLSTANTRQPVRRARKHIATGRRRPVGPTVHRRFVRAFRSAAHAGNLTDLEQLLAAEVAS